MPMTNGELTEMEQAIAWRANAEPLIEEALGRLDQVEGSMPPSLERVMLRTSIKDLMKALAMLRGNLARASAGEQTLDTEDVGQ
jgi:hypothetical protein